MLFNSIEFIVFLPIVFVFYWFMLDSKTKLQNILILVASYIFYGWWDWRFLFLIFISSIVDFFIGQQLGKSESAGRRKMLVALSIFVNLSILGVFKYYNFFVQSFVDAFSTVGITLHGITLNIILPVGISFYTFQTMSYSMDIYRKKLEPTNDVIAFFAYVSFFPQLVAGPIERASNLLPQFIHRREFSYAQGRDAMKQILWGLVKKMVIADNCAHVVTPIFDNYENLPGSMLVLGTVFFAFQIYGDFSGYSDMAIGIAKLFGFKLMVNFKTPYFSRDIGEFWRRWHISLSTWFRDYLYIPLGGSRGSRSVVVRNIFVIFLVSGFWHGANWTFIFWGGLNALYFVPLLLRNRNRVNMDVVSQGKLIPTVMELVQMLVTFGFVCIAWIFFRIDNLQNGFEYISRIFSASLFKVPYINLARAEVLILLFLFIIVEWLGREKEHPLQNLKFGTVGRWSVYIVLCMLVIVNSQNTDTFIYFQF